LSVKTKNECNFRHHSVEQEGLALLFTSRAIVSLSFATQEWLRTRIGLSVPSSAEAMNGHVGSTTRTLFYNPTPIELLFSCTHMVITRCYGFAGGFWLREESKKWRLFRGKKPVTEIHSRPPVKDDHDLFNRIGGDISPPQGRQGAYVVTDSSNSAVACRPLLEFRRLC
jgi:hypothetical protein